jgi:hypothetical protein
MVEECPPDDVDTIVNMVRGAEQNACSHGDSLLAYLSTSAFNHGRAVCWWPRDALRKPAPSFRRP